MLDKPRWCLDDDLCMWEWVERIKDVIFKLFLSSLSFSLKNMEPLSLGFNFVTLLSKWWERCVFIVPKWNYIILEKIETIWAFSRYSRQCNSSRFEHSEKWPNDIQTFCIIYRWKEMDIYFLLVFTEWHLDVCR